VQIRQGYGMTETSPVTHFVAFRSGADEIWRRRRLRAKHRVKIIDLETGEPQGTNKRGELCVRGRRL